MRCNGRDLVLNVIVNLSMLVYSMVSAAGPLALLLEPDPLLRQHSLKSLNPLISQFWARISEQIPLM